MTLNSPFKLSTTLPPPWLREHYEGKGADDA
jgi:hypothetical protein